MELEFTDVTTESRGSIAYVTINRPEVLNALRTRTYEELTSAIRGAGEDDSIGVVVLSGAGTKAFSSGGDVRDQKRRGRSEGRKHLHRVLDLATAIRNCPKPVIAKVAGYCVGGGHELHLMCDLTVAADNARFGQVGPKVGMVPVVGATQFLPRIVGEKRAREMIYTCRLYTAEQAATMGLVNEVVPLADLDVAVTRWCEEILEKSPQSLRIAKLSMNYAVDSMLPSFLDGAELVSLLYGSEEQREGAAAFVEKRKPDYAKFRRRVEA